MPGWHRLAGRLFAASVLVSVGIIARAPAADAHAVLDRASPADGATLDATPNRVELRFSERVLGSLTRLSLRDGRGATVTTLGAVALDQRHRVVTATVAPLAADVYRLEWRTVSADDLHRSSGMLVFGVQRAAGAAGAAAAPVPRPVEVVLRTIDVVATGGFVGVLVVWMWVIPPFGRWLRRRDALASTLLLGRIARTCLSLATGLSVAAVVAAATLASVRLGSGADAGGLGGQWSALGSSAYGRWSALRGLALAAVVVLLVRDRRRRERYPSRSRRDGRHRLLPALVLCSLAFDAQTSHAVTGTGRSALLVAFVTAHQAAACAWVGGVGVIAVLALHLDRSARRELARRFGPVASASVAVLVITGLVLAGRQVATLDAFLHSFYGRVLGVKLVLVAVAAALGLRHALALHRPHGANAPSTRSLLVEAASGAAVLGLAAVLTLAAPARGPQFRAEAPLAQPRSRSGQADDVLVTLAVRPNRPGRNYVTVEVHDTRRPAPAPITGVTLSVRSSDGRTVDQPATSVGAGQFLIVGDQFDRAGNWVLAVAVHRPGLPVAAFVQRWNVGPVATTSAGAASLSARPLAPILDSAALTLVAILAASGALAFRRPALPA